ELRYLGTHDEALPLDHLHHGGEHIVFDLTILGNQIEEGDAHDGPGPFLRPARAVMWKRPMLQPIRLSPGAQYRGTIDSERSYTDGLGRALRRHSPWDS